MKRLGLFLIGLMTVCLIQAQGVFDFTETSEGRVIAIPARPDFNFDFKAPEFNFSQYTSPSVYEVEKMLHDLVPDFKSDRIEERPMDIRILSKAYIPFYDEYAEMHRRMSPMAYDFSETTFTPLSENIGFMLNGVQYTWPGAGGLTRIMPSLVFHQDQWTITGSGFAGRFYTPFNASPGYMVGGGLGARYEMSERFALRAWGQYATYDGNENDNPHMLMNPFYNHTSVGGAVEYMFNEHFGVGMGVNYEYNPRVRKMEPQYMIYPVFKTKNVSIGIW